MSGDGLENLRMATQLEQVPKVMLEKLIVYKMQKEMATKDPKQNTLKIFMNITPDSGVIDLEFSFAGKPEELGECINMMKRVTESMR